MIEIEADTPNEIPRDKYKTWTLFLICTRDWVATGKKQDLANLYDRFKTFGEAIGHDNLAVWFWKSKANKNGPLLVENIDFQRSADFCRALRLDPSKGPHIVVMPQYPDPVAVPSEQVIISLGGKDLAESVVLLNKLTDSLIIGQVYDFDKLMPWMRLLESVRKSLIGVGCNVTASFKSTNLSLAFRGCPE